MDVLQQLFDLLIAPHVLTLEQLATPIRLRLGDQGARHVCNALAVMQAQTNDEWDMVAVEAPP